MKQPTRIQLRMPEKIKEPKLREKLEVSGSLRTYPVPWKGQLLLACGKCQKRLQHAHPHQPLVKLKKVVKQRAVKDGQRIRLHVIKTPCMKLCPKGGIVVCTQAQLGIGQCSILRSVEDVPVLYASCSAAEA